jgi:hypothetical protein
MIIIIEEDKVGVQDIRMSLRATLAVFHLVVPRQEFTHHGRLSK